MDPSEDFKLREKVTEIEVIATGRKIRELRRLRKSYGTGRWRKLKGRARGNFSMVRYGLRNYTGTKRMDLARKR